MSARDREIALREKIELLAATSQDVVVDVAIPHSRISYTAKAAKIVGVYPHLFRVAISDGDACVTFSFQYSDVLIGRVKIHELEI